jgi:hypothetical protein
MQPLMCKLTKDVPLRDALPVNLTGAANLKSPIGACPYGIPKYSETCESFAAGCPLTGPLLVCTVCPTVQFDCRSRRPSILEAHAQIAAVSITKAENFILHEGSLVCLGMAEIEEEELQEQQAKRLHLPSCTVRVLREWDSIHCGDLI